MDGTHGKPTFEDDLEQQLLGGQPMGNWHHGGASWEQMLGNDSSNWGKLNSRE